MRTTLFAALPAVLFALASWAGISSATVAPVTAKPVVRSTSTDCCASGEDCCFPPQACCAAVKTATTAKQVAKPVSADCCASGEDCCFPPQACCATVKTK
jgi:hypothetical protein